jgi:H/ACA ribonucleoprotein complex subunit 4
MKDKFFMDKSKIDNLLEFGIINIDKPSGPTSFSVSEFVCKTLGLRKTSHFGTLDPKVTGVLPVALNRACKLTGYFLGEDKTYVGVMRVHEERSLEEIQKVINSKFLGKINQMPPVKSRVKRVEREREVYSFELLEQGEDKKDILFKVKCEGGTYVRALCNDLGKELGVGAHMLELRRVNAGVFEEEFAVNLYEFEKAVEDYKNGNPDLLEKIIIPGENAIKKVFPVMDIKQDNLKQILTGKPIYKKDVLNDKGWKIESIVSVFCDKNFIGMYKILRGKEIFAKPEFVFQPIKQQD